MTNGPPNPPTLLLGTPLAAAFILARIDSSTFVHIDSAGLGWHCSDGGDWRLQCLRGVFLCIQCTIRTRWHAVLLFGAGRDARHSAAANGGRSSPSWLLIDCVTDAVCLSAWHLSCYDADIPSAHQVPRLLFSTFSSHLPCARCLENTLVQERQETEAVY